MARLIQRWIPWLIVVAVVAAAYFYGRDYVKAHPQDVPWTPLALDDPIGRFSRAKLAALGDNPAQCRALLRAVDAADLAAPPLSAPPSCGYDDGMRLGSAPGEAEFAPPDLVTRCPVAAALLVWERQIVQPAAKRHFNSRVRRVDHGGSYSCRRIYGRREGAFSEHARANAVDITGFRLSDGRRVSVLEDWRSSAPEGAFLREVRDGACRLFATSLSPDYNAAHADHLHLDQAARGQSGWGVCR